MDNFKVIYRILKHLEASMDYEEFDADAISPSKLGITRERWEQLLVMMQEDGYIKGIKMINTTTSLRCHVIPPVMPTITIKGLEYLANNTLMKKAANFAKGIKDVTPGL